MSEEIEQPAEASALTEKAVALLRQRDAISLSKYEGKTMDRADLTAAQWARHYVEEMADGLKYGLRVEEALLMLEEARAIIGSAERTEQGEDWLARHDAGFPAAPAAAPARQVTFTVAEICDLARFAGIALNADGLDCPDDGEAVVVIGPCPAAGLFDEGEGTVCRYRMIAWLEDYPEEGSYGLGPALPEA